MLPAFNVSMLFMYLSSDWNNAALSTLVLTSLYTFSYGKTDSLKIAF